MYVDMKAHRCTKHTRILPIEEVRTEQRRDNNLLSRVGCSYSAYFITQPPALSVEIDSHTRTSRGESFLRPSMYVELLLSTATFNLGLLSTDRSLTGKRADLDDDDAHVTFSLSLDWTTCWDFPGAVEALLPCTLFLPGVKVHVEGAGLFTS